NGSISTRLRTQRKASESLASKAATTAANAPPSWASCPMTSDCAARALTASSREITSAMPFLRTTFAAATQASHACHYRREQCQRACERGGNNCTERGFVRPCGNAHKAATVIAAHASGADCGSVFSAHGQRPVKSFQRDNPPPIAMRPKDEMAALIL